MSKHKLHIRNGSPVKSAVIQPNTPRASQDEEYDVDSELDTEEHDEGAAESESTDEPVEGLSVAEEIPGSDAEIVTEAPVRVAANAAKARAARALPAEVTVLPLMSVGRMRIGKPWFNFVSGVKCTVPREILPLLIQRGIVAHGTR